MASSKQFFKDQDNYQMEKYIHQVATGHEGPGCGQGLCALRPYPQVTAISFCFLFANQSTTDNEALSLIELNFNY